MQKKGILLSIVITIILFSCKTTYYYKKAIALRENTSISKIKNVLDTARLETVTGIKGIPKKAIKFLNRIDLDHERFRIVNPGEEYDAVDIFTGKPRRQLIVILKNKRYFIMTYKHGGRGRHGHILYFEFNNNKIVNFWVGYGGGEDAREIIALLNNEMTPQIDFIDF